RRYQSAKPPGQTNSSNMCAEAATRGIHRRSERRSIVMEDGIDSSKRESMTTSFRVRMTPRAPIIPPMKTSLNATMLTDASAALREANVAFAKAHPGESPGRQPVHTVYGGAQLFSADSARKLGGVALRMMD